MKIAHLSHTDAGAGAGRAAYRIHRSLLDLGEDSTMFVSSKRTDDPSVVSVSKTAYAHTRARFSEYLEAKLARRIIRTPPSGLFSPARFGHFNPAAHPKIAAADVVSLYWVSGGFMTPESLTELKQPIVWRLSDVWPFTGGCHYPGSCTHYTLNCGNCPQLSQPHARDSSHHLTSRKQQAWENLNLTIAAPSEWMATIARSSSLFGNRRVVVIPTGVDTTIYQPRNRTAARAAWSIPPDRIVVLFGAMDTSERRKGFAELRGALEILATTPLRNRLLAVVFGSSSAPNLELPIPTQFLGRLNNDDHLANAYSAADIVIVPSLEDNLPNVALEAIACGTPVVGFNVCGMGDIVRNDYNGALAETINAAALARAIAQVLTNGTLPTLGANARTHAISHFSLTGQAKAYLQLYRELVNR